MAPTLPVPLHDELLLGPDKVKAEVAIRQLRREIRLANEELKELEEALVQDMLTPTVRQWLLPLMVIGLVISLYGSVMADNTAELGATGLVLLWSLTAFWFIHTRDRRLAMAKQAHRAEIEIWSNRIAELETTIEQNQRIVEAASHAAA